MICNECELPSNIELGQLMFSPNVIHNYDCEDWIVALLRDLDRKLQIVMWNINQEEYDVLGSMGKGQKANCP